MQLSEELAKWRADRPDEWKMDEFIRNAAALEAKRDAALANIQELRHALLIVNETLLGARVISPRTRSTIQRALETTPEGCALRAKFAALCEAIEKAEGSDSPMRELRMLAESYRGRMKP